MSFNSHFLKTKGLISFASSSYFQMSVCFVPIQGPWAMYTETFPLDNRSIYNGKFTIASLLRHSIWGLKWFFKLIHIPSSVIPSLKSVFSTSILSVLMFMSVNMHFLNMHSNDLNTYKICSTNRCRSRLGGKKLQRYDQVRYAKIELIYLHNTPSLIQGDLSKSKGHLIMQSINSSNSSAARILPQIPCGLKFFDKVLSQTKKFGLSSDHGKISAFRHSILSSML